jgi:erythronate-4-phosphate dehydrogenase
MIGIDWIQTLRKPIALLNACRGKIAVEAALLEGKNSGVLRNLVLDVFPDEPAISPALANACDLMTPHVAGYSVQGKLQGTEQVLQAFMEHFGLKKDSRHSGIEWPEPAEKNLWQLKHANQSPPETLLDILLEIYPIEIDDRALRNSLDKPNPFGEFDRLRKHYPRRFEAKSFQYCDNNDKKNIWLQNHLLSLKVGLN